MCKIKTLSGAPLRCEFSAFEIEALKNAVALNLKPGVCFPFRTETPGFTVLDNSETVITLCREINGKVLTAAKVGGVDAPAVPAAPAPAKVEEQTTKPAVAAPAGGAAISGGSVEAALATLAAALNKPQTAQIDAAAVAAIVNEQLTAKVEELRAANTHRVEVNRVEVPALDSEILHKDFETVLFNVQNEIPTYLVGPAGTGKNVLSEQVAKALNLPFFYAGSLQNKYELEGFVDATGNYQETEFYRAFTGGGLFLFDEIDGTAAEVLVAFNAALANRYYNFPGKGRIKAHDNFRVIAAGNTAGRGADESYCGRFQLDASTLDRFAFVTLTYDERIETAAAGGDSALVTFAHSLRAAVAKQGLTYTVTPRCLSRVAKYTAGGWDAVKSLRVGLVGSWDAADIKLLQANLAGSGKWFDAFKKL